MAPYALQRRLEEARLAADEADLEKLHGAGLGPLDVGDEENLWVHLAPPPLSASVPTHNRTHAHARTHAEGGHAEVVH